MSGESEEKTNGYVLASLSNQFSYFAAFPGSPQSFQIIELSRANGKDVYHEINIIQEDPFAFRAPLDMERADSFLTKPLFNTVRNGLVVPAGRAGTDHEVVGEGANVGEFDDYNVLRFLIQRSFQCFS